MFIAGRWVDSDRVIEIRNPFDGSLIDTVPKADADQIAEILTHAASYDYSLTAWRRYEILRDVHDALLARRQEFRRIIALESGKTLRDADIEINRSAQTFLLSAEEAKRINGETIPVDAAPGMTKSLALTMRVPVGVVLAISPFNYPLNLVAHKVGPAIAANNPVILKPASSTPLTAMMMAQLFEQAGLPSAMLQVVSGDSREIGTPLITAPCVRKISFTGSVPVGKAICAQARLQSVCMELGGNDPLIILADADLDKAVPAAIDGAFGNNGQRCTSVKRIIVENAVADEFVRRFAQAAAELVVGDQMDAATDVGPLIDEKSAIEVEERINDAVARGAVLLCGGKRQGALMWPSVVDHVPLDAPLIVEETFGPVAPILRVADFAEAVALANATPFGLQVGLFTNDLAKAMDGAARLEAGAVMLNRGPGFRAEHIPFGGVKDSGLGREGVKYAVESMTTLKTIVFSP